MSFATKEGTKRYSERILTANNHFRVTSKETGSLTLSSLGMGTYLGEMDDNTDKLVEQAVVQSIESGGINVIDTAINYRYQKSERSIKRALFYLIKKRGYNRNEIFISTKNGYIPGDADEKISPRGFGQGLIRNNIIKAKDVVGGIHCMSPPFLEDQLRRSQVNLGLETIDLMYLHNASEAQLASVGRKTFMNRLNSAFAFFEEKRKENRIQYYGMATWNCFRVSPTKKKEHLNLTEIIEMAEAAGGSTHGFKFVQLPINTGMLEAYDQLWQDVNGSQVSFLTAAQKLGVKVFSSVPLMQTQLFQTRVPILPHLETKAQRLLQLVRSLPTKSLIAPLVGHKSLTHVKENLELIQVPPLDEEEYSLL